MHILISDIGLDDDTYREMLRSFGVNSSKNLTSTEAQVLIDILQNKNEKLSKNNSKKYDDFHGRANFIATPPQMRKLEALWADICQYNETTLRAKTLRGFLNKRFHVFDIRFLTKKRAMQIIPVMEKMKNNKILKAL